jgi:glycosyltransferase involved in cell wall biosynthesis
MRILTLCYEFPPLGGGGSRVVSGLSRELVALGHDVEVITMGFRGLPAEDLVDGVRVHRVACLRFSRSVCSPAEQASYLFAALPVALRRTRRGRFDVNHTHFIFPDGVLARVLRWRTGLPFVITAHGSDVPRFNPDRFTTLHKVLAPAWRRIVRQASGIVAPSERLAGLIRSHAPEVHPILIPNGIDPDLYRSDCPKVRRILVVSRLFERKGVQHLLEALTGTDLDHEVHIVGTGPYLPNLEAQVRERGLSVSFHGWMDHESSRFRELYETSSIFVCPSEAENFPIVLLEAMSAGLAIVTTRGTGCDEVVGDTGVLVPPRDPLALRQALVELAHDPGRCRILGAAARKRLEERFSWPAVAARYAEILAEVAQGGR